MGNHEWCFYGWKEGAAHRFFGPPNVPDVWSVKKVNPASMVHLTEKPVELSRLAIEYSSLPGEAVLDLFAGSGSHAHRRRADRAARLRHGARPALLRRHRRQVRGVHRARRPSASRRRDEAAA